MTLSDEQTETLAWYRQRYRDLQTLEARNDLFAYCRWLRIYVLRRVPA